MCMLPPGWKHRRGQRCIEDRAHWTGNSSRGELQDGSRNTIRTKGLIDPQVREYFLAFIGLYSAELEWMGTLSM